MDQYEQMKKDFPTMYVRLMRNDSKVRCVAAGPAVAVASGVLLDMINRGELCQPRPEVPAEVFDKDVMTSSMDNYLTYFANLAEEAGMPDVAKELHETAADVNKERREEAAAAEAKPAKKPRKPRVKRTDPSNFPM